MDYNSLRRKYGAFDTPVMDLVVEGKSFADSRGDMIISDVTAELVSGFEASEAVVHIYNCYDAETGRYLFEYVKPYVLLGSKVSLRMGYLAGLEEVFRGLAVQVQFWKTGDGYQCMELRAMDVKGIMMANTYVCQLRAADFGGAVKEIFRKPVYQDLKNRGIIERVKIEETPDKNLEELQEMTGESDYAFVVRAAKRFGYEFFTEKGIVHFARADRTKKPDLTLSPKEGLLTWQIAYDVRGLVQTVEVRGMNAADGKAAVVQKKLDGSLSRGNKVNALLSQTKKVYVDAAAGSKESAGWRADALLDKMACRFGTLECTVQGIPELQPGQMIQVKGLGEPADNRFYLTKVKHVMDEEGGYRTIVSGTASSLL